MRTHDRIRFILVFPADWNIQTGNPPVIVLYAAGLGITTLGGAVVPLVVGATREDLAASQRRAEDSAASQRRAEDLAGERDALKPQLESLRASQAQLELYEDGAGQYRRRLRHRNSNVIADGGEGYASRHGIHDAIVSVKRNAPGAGTAGA